MGNRCKFIHDSHLVRGDRDARSNGRLMKESITSSNAHCWSYVQGKCKNSSTCPYFHPSNPIPYKKYTPCLLWPKCLAGDHCSFKHPRPLKEPLQPAASNSAIALSSVTSALEDPRFTCHQDDSFDSSPSTLPQIASPVPKYFAGSRLKLFDRDFSGDLYQHPHFSPSYYAYGGVASTPLAYGDRTVSKAQFLQSGTPRFQPGHARRISVPVRNPDTNFIPILSSVIDNVSGDAVGSAIIVVVYSNENGKEHGSMTRYVTSYGQEKTSGSIINTDGHSNRRVHGKCRVKQERRDGKKNHDHFRDASEGKFT
ncbi:hypothetical protein GG344DRAFT_61721 [Lentinula edodes]|nr:hypothetical protein GG344DRAFT_61721 [Lentinula edodes]